MLKKEKKKAVVLLSGGADSVTCLALAALREGLSCIALSFRYGQRHSFEMEAARLATRRFGAEHVETSLDERLFAASALTGTGEIPLSRSLDEIGIGIPTTYVPARNLVFLSLACALAETTQSSYIYIGVNALDWSGYPDCRPEFISAFENVARLGTKQGAQGNAIEIKTPLLDLKKSEIFTLGTNLGVDYAQTVSCYVADDSGKACGKCDACLLRAKGFEEAGIKDPTRYLL